MGQLNAATFPSRILITLGTAFGESGGFHGLKQGDVLVLKKYEAGSSSTLQQYTEDGTYAPKIDTYPNIPDPANRLLLRLSQPLGAAADARLWGGGTLDLGGFATLYLADAYFAVYYWGWPGAGIAEYRSADATPQSVITAYDFLELYDRKMLLGGGDLFGADRCLAKLETYYPDLDVTAGTGGSAEMTTPAVGSPEVGESVTVKATPSAGYEFVNWTAGEGGAELSTDAEYIFDMPDIGVDETYEVYANFEAIMPEASSTPTPADGANNVSKDITLEWVAGDLADSHNVYFDTVNPPVTKVSSEQVTTTYVPGTLIPETTYYWRVDEVNDAGITAGTVWSFTVAAEPSVNDIPLLNSPIMPTR